MTKLYRLSDFSVVTALLFLSLFFSIRLWLGADPSNPLAWEAFLSVPTLIREPANYVYYATDLPLLQCALAFGGLTLLGGFLAVSKRHIRTRFVFFHATLLLFGVGLGNDFSGGQMMPMLVEGMVQHVVTYLKGLNASQLIFLLLFIVSCLNCHREILMALSSNERTAKAGSSRSISRLFKQLPHLLGLRPVQEGVATRRSLSNLAAVRQAG
jgi:hypothetical protein